MKDIASTRDASGERAGERERADERDKLISQVRAIVRAIPVGRVLAYGQVGAQCEPPLSGYICGRILHYAMEDVPWWRVVAKTGALPIGKRRAELAQQQRALLESEGVTFENDCVASQCFAQ